MFEELIKSIELENGLVIPKIKGHAKIELTDVNTGKKEVIEHDNTFQSAVIAAYMRSMGAFNSNPYNNGTWRGIDMLRNLVGGIFCFENTIAAGKKYMPAGNRMIANGAYGISNSTTPVELGSYNSIESVLNNDSATFVYDWNTAQGNGEISCVCLTSETGGLIGYGNPSGGKYANPIHLFRNQSGNNLGNYIVANDNIGYSFGLNNTAKTLTVTKRRIAISKATIFDNKTIETITFNYDNALTSTALYFSIIGDGKIAIIPYTTINNNTTFYFLVYDYVNDTLAEKKIINNVGRRITTYLYWGLETGTNCGIIGNYAYIFALPYEGYTPTNTLYKFNITTGALEETITTSERRNERDFWNTATMSRLTDELYNYGGDNAIMIVYDPVNGTTYPTNGYNALAAGATDQGYNFLEYDDENDALIAVGGTESETKARAYKQPLFLATINNLDTPVEKTASKTMKITYTLTLAE